jgi:SAM-dependent methyltransferase
MTRHATFFVVGCARSGTTSLCRILDSADNAICLLEPAPNLNRECRDVIEGRFDGDVEALLRKTVIARVEKHHGDGVIYGEKNVTLAPFVQELHSLLDCRFIFVHRDGRDVASSLVNWHNELFGSVYRECRYLGDLSPAAYAAVSALPLEEDSSDYSRPRPRPGDIWHDRWEQFSRLEMCAWYWSRMNELYLNKLQALPSERWIAVDYTRPSPEDIERLVEFLGLRGLSLPQIRSMLDARINSLADRTGVNGRFPQWRDWGSVERAAFESIAAGTMQRLGYYPQKEFVRYRPPNYGEWWRRNKGGLDWYTWMFNGRRPAHEDLLRFVREMDEKVGRLCSVLDVGCGLAVGYADAFPDRRYVGLDLSEKEITWCRAHRANSRHEYVCSDVITDPPAERFDIVFSQGTIDNSYDMDAHLRALVACSKGWIYVTAYRGWFPDLSEHRYVWDETTTCFYNDISPSETRKVLEGLGCTDVRIEPLRMDSSEIPFETRMTARVPSPT